MPTLPKTTENMRKHLTRAERESRAAAEADQRRPVRVILRMPEWLSEDAAAIWKATRRKLAGIDLLDNTDSDLLAVYCEAYAHFQAASQVLSKARRENRPTTKDEVTAAQSWGRLVGSLAEKLGLSPTGKARLARRKAQETPLDPMEQLLGEVDEYVNHGDE
jgi:P27 family predicted phage terminase small subunit